LAKDDTISSTEKLLELIRGKSDPGSDMPDPMPSLPSKIKSKSFSFKAFALRKRITIGVNIGYHDLKIVEISQTGDKKQELLNFSQVPFEPGLSLDSPKFPQFLKATLAQFCGGVKNAEIWSAISSARVEIRYLRIPKVPRKQLANAVFWSFRKEVSFNEKEEIFDFEVLGEMTDKGVRKTEVMAYSAPREEVQQLITTFSKSGFPLTGVTIIPFVIQNLLRTNWIEAEGKNLCSLYIGRDWSRIDIFSEGNLTLSRGIKAGIGSMIEAIRQEVFSSPVEYAIELGGAAEPLEQVAEEVPPQEFEEARKIFFNFIRNDSPKSDLEGFELEKLDVLNMILPALDRLVRQVERTLEHYSLHFGNQAVSKIYISGAIGGQQLVVNQIGEQLGLPIDVLDPFVSVDETADERLLPETASERESFVPAVGMALSRTAITPNFIFTYKEKIKSTKIQRINYSVFALLIFLMVVGIGGYFWQNHLVSKKKSEIARLEQHVASMIPYLDQGFIQDLVDQIGQKRMMVKETGKRYIGLAAISEICSLTPPHIRLSSIVAEMGEISTGKQNKQQKNLLVIDGIISGDRLTFETSLADYLVKLKSSPLFDQPNIKKKSFEFMGEDEVLRFTAELVLP
jgi:type IV pilus assembly protein PilM